MFSDPVPTLPQNPDTRSSRPPSVLASSASATAFSDHLFHLSPFSFSLVISLPLLVLPSLISRLIVFVYLIITLRPICLSFCSICLSPGRTLTDRVLFHLWLYLYPWLSYASIIHLHRSSPTRHLSHQWQLPPNTHTHQRIHPYNTLAAYEIK